MKRYINSIIKIKNWSKFWIFYYSSKKNYQAEPFIAKLRSGLSAKIPPDLISAFDEIFLREVYKSDIKNLKENPIIIDIGANAGYFSLYIYSKFPLAKVISFEPIPSNFFLLEQQKNYNNLKKLFLDNRAVMGISNIVDIHYNNNIKTSVGASIINRSNSNTLLKVRAISIPQIFEEYQLDHCDLLKIDCEGAEYDILQNCPSVYLKKINRMVIEVHGWVPESLGTIQGLIKFLQKNNFKVKNNQNEILWCTKL